MSPAEQLSDSHADGASRFLLGFNVSGIQYANVLIVSHDVPCDKPRVLSPEDRVCPELSAIMVRKCYHEYYLSVLLTYE